MRAFFRAHPIAETMQFSVVIPCHNAEVTIAQTLRSIAAQTLAPHEIIVVDDASTDDSHAQIAASGVDVKLIEADVHDSGTARNLGIARASGDWVALCDADDVWFPHHLEQAAQVLTGGEDVAYMANHCFLLAGEEKPIPDSMRHPIEHSGGGRDGVEWIDLLAEGLHFGHSTVIYRRDLLDRIGGFDETFQRQEDLDLWLRAINSGTWGYGARQAMAYRVDTPGSQTKAVIKSAYFNMRALCENRHLFPSTAMSGLINNSTRRALSLAFVDGTPADFRAAWQIARPYISPQLRAFYRVANLIRPLARGAIRLKRRWVWRGQPGVGTRRYE